MVRYVKIAWLGVDLRASEKTQNFEKNRFFFTEKSSSFKVRPEVRPEVTQSHLIKSQGTFARSLMMMNMGRKTVLSDLSATDEKKDSNFFTDYHYCHYCHFSYILKKTMAYFLGTATTDTNCHFMFNFVPPFLATATIATQEKKAWYIF